MTPSPLTRPSPAVVSRARWAVATLFALNGATFASMVPRYPDIIDKLEMSHTVFGLVLALGPLGAMLSGPFTGMLLKRVPSARLATDAQLVTLLIVGLVLTAPAIWVFALGFALYSVFDVYTDVGQNAHGLRVQREAGRSLINGFHAFWSFGAMLGGLLGAVLASWDVSLQWHAVIVIVLLAIVNLVVRSRLLPGPDTRPEDEVSPDESATAAGEAGEAPARRIPKGVWVFAALGLVAAAGASIEDAGFTWSTLYLGELGAPAGLAGAGVVVLMAAHTLGRLTGDRLVDRFGEQHVVRIGCAAATVALLAALLWPSIPLTLVAFAIAGWGVAAVVPAAFHAADNVPGLGHGVGLSIVNLMLRAAFIIGPPLVGRISDLVDLRTALFVMPLATVAVVLLTPVLAPRRR